MSTSGSPTRATPAFSVVIVTLGRKTALLERCIRSLHNQTLHDFELIVVYKHFPEPLKPLFDAYPIRCVPDTASTVGGARNLGVQHAHSPLIAMIDDDAEAPPDWLEKIAATFQRHPSLVCVGGPHINPEDESRTSLLRYLEGSFLEAYLTNSYVNEAAVGKIATCNVTYRRVVFDQIGFFNERMKAGEDWEFNERLVEKGYSLRFDPEIFVWHHRQGLKHTFKREGEMVPFFLSWRTLKFARYESLFASFYLSNIIVLFFLAMLIVFPNLFLWVFLAAIVGHSLFTALRTQTLNWRMIFFPLAISFTVVRLLGFYVGVVKYVSSIIRRSVAP
jgi:GT2 family glycosyltransferase